MAQDVSNFEEEVLQASGATPVVVDFWAPWCGPCRYLGPVLEKLEAESDGRWTLRKVNADDFPELSMRYGIRGIPAVKLFVDGDVVDEFTGALPEAAVRQWLDKALPTEARRLVDEAETALLEGDVRGAEAKLRTAVEQDASDGRARILLARIVLFRDPEDAEALVDGASFAGPTFVQMAEAVRTIARLLRIAGDSAELPDEPGAERYREGIAALARQDVDAALTAFVEVIGANRYYDDDGARKACIALFMILGEQHPVTRRHRRAFDMALY